MPAARQHLHHVGLVVPDLDEAIEWLADAFQLRVLLREPDTDVDGVAIGLPGEPVRLRGALMGPATDDVAIELHQFLQPVPSTDFRRRTSDLGPGHLAWRTDNIDGAVADLRDRGVEWNRSEPLVIAQGPYRGRRWIYGWAAVIRTTIELLQEP